MRLPVLPVRARCNRSAGIERNRMVGISQGPEGGLVLLTLNEKRHLNRQSRASSVEKVLSELVEYRPKKLQRA